MDFDFNQPHKIVNGEPVYLTQEEIDARAAEEAAWAAQAGARLAAACEQAVQQHLDAQAKAHGYDNIFTAVTYADEHIVPTFQAEGEAFRAWRSLVWEYCYTQMAAVQAQERAAPTPEELVAEIDEHVPLTFT